VTPTNFQSFIVFGKSTFLIETMTKTMTNENFQTSLTANIFNCEFCGYQSKLDLCECPGCGRLRRHSTAPNNRRPETPGFQTANFTAVSDNIPRFEQKTVYECQHCRYRTPNRIGECPDCGRQEFVETAAAVEIAAAVCGNHRSDRAVVGISLIGIGIGLFGAALFIFMGLAPGQTTRTAIRVAAAGDNWIGALVASVIGAVLIVVGARLKMDD
jgi:hypothetical protein